MFACKKKGGRVFNKRENKMKCSEVILLLNRYQDNELEQHSGDRMKRHLSVCKNCRVELAELNRISRDLAGIRDVEPKENFTAEVMSLIKEHKEKKFEGKFAYIYSFVFALFFIFGVLIDPYPSSGSSEDTGKMELSSILLDSQKFISDDNHSFVIIELAGGKDEKGIH